MAMIDEKEIEERAVKEIISKLTDGYERNSLLKRIEEKIAEIAAKEFYEKNKLDILKGIDVDTVCRIATLQMLMHIKRDFGER